VTFRDALIGKKKYTGCSVPIDAFKPTVTESFTAKISNPNSITSEKFLGFDVPGVTSSTFEVSPKNRKIAQHVEPFFWESININRGGDFSI
jgi:hypothetical protein